MEHLVATYENCWAECINDQLLDLQQQKQDRLAYGLTGVYDTMNEFTGRFSKFGTFHIHILITVDRPSDAGTCKVPCSE